MWNPRTKAICLVVACYSMFHVPISHAQAPSSPTPSLSESVAEHLAANEFQSAARIANRADDVKLRDQLLSDIARRQAEVGDSAASVLTALTIQDDQIQFQTLRQQPALWAPPAAGPNNNAFDLDTNEPTGEARGGGTQADFDTLIDLITTTVAPDNWQDNGGTGALDGHAGGVIISTDGLLTPTTDKNAVRELSRIKNRIRRATGDAGSDVGIKSIDEQLIAISLPRLETALLVRQAVGKPPTDEMRSLGGMQQIRYVLTLPDTHDVVVVGSAGTQSPHRLESLAWMLFHQLASDEPLFCSIEPRQSNLAATQAFLAKAAASPLRPDQRQSWLDSIQSKMGRQDIVFAGVDPTTHVARTMIAADYHMKLIGMGLVPAPGMSSYLDRIELDENGAVAPLDILRWWFTLAITAPKTDLDRLTFSIPTDVVRVQSENELLGERGARITTGRSDPPNRDFATSFTHHFPQLCEEFAVYDELRWVFQFAVAARLIQQQRLCEKAGWQPTLLAAGDKYLVPKGRPPTEVESIVNHRVINRRHIVAGISGGVDLAVNNDLPDPKYDPSSSVWNDVRDHSRPMHDRHESVTDELTWCWDVEPRS